MDQANHAGLLEDVKRVIENAAQQGDLATP
jgi:hypothetical protein